MISFLEHFPYAAKASNCEIACVTGQGTPGEMLSLSFAISSEDTIDNVELLASQLGDGKYSIPSDCVDLLIVKTWEQAGIGVYQTAPVLIPELLVKDDRTPIRDGYTRRGSCGHWKHLIRRSKIYAPPEIRMSGPACTSLRRGETKHVWVTIRIPREAEPGMYSGYVQATADGAPKSSRLTLEIEVLPFHLLEAEQDLFMWYKGTLDCHMVQNYVVEKVFRAQLQDIYDHGFRSISLNEKNPDLLQRALDIADSVGFRRNVVLTAVTPAALTGIDFKRLTPIYYVSDEIDVRDDDATAAHVAKWSTIKNANGRTMASLVGQSFARKLFDAGDIGAAPDVLSYYLPANASYFLAHSEFQSFRERSIYYYWQSHMEKPDVHRVLAGVYLWKSGANGIAPYCYQHLPPAPNSPFDDFDDWDSDVRAGSDTRRFKDHMTTYPARNGSIPTLQWKGLSDGIVDLRYLTTLESHCRAAEESPSNTVRAFVAEARSRCDRFLKRISLKNIDIASDTSAVPYRDIETTEYAAFRVQLARDIVTLAELEGRAAGDQ